MPTSPLDDFIRAGLRAGTLTTDDAHMVRALVNESACVLSYPHAADAARKLRDVSSYTVSRNYSKAGITKDYVDAILAKTSPLRSMG